MAKQWAAFLILNAVLASSLAFALFAPSSGLQTQLLPGKTTHGHYQIELECEACHTSGKGVEQDACLKCHERELKDAKDTHPASKFNDPTNAARLELLDAQKCVTCHKEHVEERTSQMGLTLPADYCYHCHQETLSTRPSHTDLAFDSCATAGCHNYHDNRALYENFLNKHYGEPDFLEQNVVLARNIDLSGPAPAPDAPKDKLDREILAQWGRTAHGRHDVNCTGCHATPSDTDVGSDQERWNDGVTVDICATCHAGQAEGFLAGRHGMRLDQGLSPMSPSDARLEMRHDANHRNLDCNACHAAHTYDTDFAAVDACLNCHADSHSLAYRDTGHFDAWQGRTDWCGAEGFRCDLRDLSHAADQRCPRAGKRATQSEQQFASERENDPRGLHELPRTAVLH